MRQHLRLPSEIKLALIIIGIIVTYALYRVGGPALALASNAISAIAGWMGRGLADKLGSPHAPSPIPGRPPAPPVVEDAPASPPAKDD